MTDKKIIVDCGANNGDDTEYYLKKGFKVISIEADPDLSIYLVKRFPEYILNKDLVVENVAIASEEGEVEFYKNTSDEWSSILLNSKATQKNEYKTLKVKSQRLDLILKDVNNIYYIKLDVEGAELFAYEAFVNFKTMPPYTSFELNPDKDKILSKLISCGYNHFQISRQGQKYLNLNKHLPSKEGNDFDIMFTNRHSGCFGKDLNGKWLSFPELEKEILSLDWISAWYDVHARHNSVV